MSRKQIICLWIWILLLAAAFAVDQPVKIWLYQHHWHDESARIFKGSLLALRVKMLGDIRTIAVILATAVGFAWIKPSIRQVRSFSFDLRRAIVVLACAATSVLSDVIKWIAGRQRPIAADGSLTPPFDFVPFHLRPAGFAFVSGHTMLAFATATCLAWYYPRLRYLWFALAMLVACERILEVAHHVSDVVAAAGLGILCAMACLRYLYPWSTARDPGTVEQLQERRIAS